MNTVLNAEDNTYQRIEKVTCHRISIIEGRVILQLQDGEEERRSVYESFYEFLVHIGVTEF